MRVLVCAAAASIFILAGWNLARAASKPATTQPYPLETCVVSDGRLGEMGEPNIIHHDGREVRLCCKHCEKDFAKDPQKYLKKLDDAAKTAAAKQPSTQPSPKSDPAPASPAGHDHGHMHGH